MTALSCDNLVRSHLEYLGDAYSCRETPGRWWITAPFAYPDGDLVEVAVRDQGDGTVAVSDLGETLRHLAGFGYDPRTTANGRYLVQQIVKQHDATLDESGAVFTRVPQEAVGEAIQAMIATSLALSHLVFLSRAIRPTTIQEEVRQLLSALEVEYEPNFRIQGMTGQRYTLDFKVLGHRQTALVKTIGSGTPGGAKNATNAAFRLWSDIEQGPVRATVIDDRVVSWKEVDLRLLSRVSEVYRWAESRDLFEKQITSL